MTSGELAWLTRRIGRALVPYKRLCAIAVFAMLVEVGYGALSAMSFAWLIDKAIVPRNPVMLWSYLGLLAAAVCVASGVGIAMDYLQASVAARAVHDARSALFAKLCEPPDALSGQKPGDIVTRFSADLAAIEVTIGGALPAFVRSILSLFVATTLLFVLDVRLAAISILLLPLCLLFPRLFAKHATHATEERRDAEATLFGVVSEALENQVAITALALEKTMLQRFAEKTANLVGRSVRGTFLGTLVHRSSAMSVNVLELALVALVATFAYHGLITVGTILSFHALFMQTSLALLGLTQIGPTILGGRVGFQRVDEMLACTPAVRDASDARPAGAFRRRLDFIDVRFGYDPDFPVLSGVSMSIRAGEAVAIVGPSGSGKSTIASLLMRFYDPNSGEVRMDGVPLRDVTQESLRGQIGYVMQSPVLFDATLRDNVRFGRITATDAEVQEACRAAEVHEFVSDLPDGYDTLLGSEGVSLSGGQLQRVAIARALLRNAAILLLDEPTAALDPTTEASIMSTLAKVRKGRTILLITHGLTTITDFDRIIVIDDGKVAEEGRHEELLAKGGLYTRLWGAQGVHVAPRELRGPPSRKISLPPPSLVGSRVELPTSSIPSRR